MTIDYSRPLGTNESGKLNNKISIEIKVVGEDMFKSYLARDWAAARGFFASADFKAIAGTVEFITFTNLEN